MHVKFKKITNAILMTLLLGALLPLPAGAQTGTINVRGTVTDVAGEPVIGANILIQGTSSGTVTDYDGNFTLQAPANGVLEVSYIGYQPRSIPIDNRITINVILQEDTELLEELVVIGYGTVRKEDATGSVVAVDATKINRGLATSPTELLAGQVAGLSVVSAGGAPGSSANIRIRGGSSMSASNDPLIVIDGVPVDTEGINGMENPLSTINSNDIETFTVLKDASATAIYGSRASNGVIIITTKKGHSGKTRVNYTGNMSVSTKTGIVDVMDAPTFRNYVVNSFGADSPQAAALGNTETNWQNKIFRVAASTDHNLSVSGSMGETLPYRVSVGYTNENGILRTSGLERYTGSINLSPTFFDDALRVQLNAKGVYNTNRFADRGAINSATQFDPTMPVYSTNSPYGNGYYMSLKADGAPIDIGLANPLAILNQRHDNSKVYRSIGNLQLDYNLPFLEGLRANLNLGYDISESNGDVIIEDNSPMTWVWGDYKAGWGENSTYYQYKSNTLLDFYLNYVNNFGIHRIDAMGGYSWQRFYREEENTYPNSAARASETGEEFYKEGNDYFTESYVISFFGRLNYSLLGRYLLTFTLRNDGSSRFSPDNKWGLFPSAAFAWRVIDEPFMEDAGNVMSDLKLRLGYGVTGQQNLGNDSGDYPWMGRYSYSQAGANYFFGDQRVPLIRPLAYDENLKWEETATYNAGLDFGFLNNRVSGAVDVYYRKTTDLLNTVGIAAGTNFSNQLLTNVGELENKGIELTLTGRPIVSKDLNWDLSYNISYNQNRITKLTINDDPSYVGVRFGGIDGGTGNNIAIHSVNYPANSFYVFEQVYDNDGRPVEGAYVDQNADGAINDDDLIVYKNPAPDLFMGLSSQLSYKNWDLNFSLRSNIGNHVYNNIQSNRESRSITYDPSGWLKNRVNSATYTNFDAVHYQSSYYIQNASFVKMDNISVGYNFGHLLHEPQSGRIYFTVQNPFVITKYKGLDPEFTNDGIDNNIYPHPRVFIMGLSLNF